ncbi:HD-GYP domain-containing protein [Kiloniella laminariae]|uniref:HD-GYP domain-containing protein n=1 Tax=Kiloniella laminariae TaxID=454162 RepID=UPI0003660851|nr:HD domain-containing protein [Kiloniella laminariae]
MVLKEVAEKSTSKIRLSELLSALSHALDLTEGQPAGHCIRCCWIGIRLGEHMGLKSEELSDLYYTLLLKDLGCSSNAARICSHYLTDDISFKHDFKKVDGSLTKVLGFVLSHTGMQAGMAERFRAILHILQNGGELARELIETRCNRGADIAAKMHFSERVTEGIRNLDEHWDGSGLPERRKGHDIPLFSQIALLAQVVDVFASQGNVNRTLEEIKARSGSWFSPELVTAFVELALDINFWNALEDPGLDKAIYLYEPGQAARYVDDDYLDDIAEAFAQVVDSKSPFTAGHSERVTVFADLIAQRMGFSEERRRWLRRAALLHDIGKLGISNSILDKPGKLTDEEFIQIKLHPVYSENILKQISALKDLVPVAVGHHERLDGKGYPYGLKGDEIPLETRIVTVADIFDALSADRPYRAAMPLEKALAIMQDMVDSAIDPECFAMLKEVIVDLEEAVA